MLACLASVYSYTVYNHLVYGCFGAMVLFCTGLAETGLLITDNARNTDQPRAGKDKNSYGS